TEAAADEDADEQTRDALRFLLSGRRHSYLPRRTPGHARPADSPGRIKQRQSAKAGTADAYDPLRRLLTASEIGLAGHSRGADACCRTAGSTIRPRRPWTAAATATCCRSTTARGSLSAPAVALSAAATSAPAAGGSSRRRATATTASTPI